MHDAYNLDSVMHDAFDLNSVMHDALNLDSVMHDALNLNSVMHDALNLDSVMHDALQRSPHQLVASDKIGQLQNLQSKQSWSKYVSTNSLRSHTHFASLKHTFCLGSE